MNPTYIRAGHLHGSGFIVKARAAIKGIDIVGTSSAGLLNLWDTDVPPVTGSYGRSGTTVTVTDEDHGLSTGDVVGISFEPDGGVIATPGNYEITVVDADTFTLTDINTGTIANDPACYYVHSNTDNTPARWMTTNHTAANDTYFNGWMLPENGIIARKGVYVQAVNLVSVNVYYG